MCYNNPNLTTNIIVFYIILTYGLKKETKFSHILNLISKILTVKTQFMCQNSPYRPSSVFISSVSPLFFICFLLQIST